MAEASPPESLPPDQAAISSEDAESDPLNPYTDYVPYNLQEPPEVNIQVLIQNIDFGVSQNHSAEVIFEKAVSSLDPTIKGAFSDLGDDGLVTFIESNVPLTWPINSVQGEETVRSLVAMLG